jgi:hypothetical protein
VSEEPPNRSALRAGRRSRLRIGAVLAAALAVAFVVWLIVGRDGDDGGNGANASGARAVTRAELVAFARTLQHPVYWAGPMEGQTYELTRTASGRVYVRYLPSGVDVGDRRPRYLTVGTYPQADAYRAVREAAKRPETVSRRASGGALIVYDPQRPRSVYFTFPRARFQVEVFAPDADRARDLTYSGRIEPVS